MMPLVVTRLLTGVPTLAGISLLAFALSTATPGDPAAAMLQRQTSEVPSEAAVAALRHRLHLDHPLPVRYAYWLGDVAAGHLGRSFRTGEDVAGLLAAKIPYTAALAIVTLLAATVIGVPGGMLAAAFQSRPIDRLVRLLALLGDSWPTYVVAYALMAVFAVRLGWLPVAGGETWAHVVLPAATLTMGLLAGVVRLTRRGVLDALAQDYVPTARARGLSRAQVVVRHAWPVGAPLLVAFSGVRIAHLLGGAVVVETVFAWPGLGQALVTAVFDRDYPVIQALVLLSGLTLVVVNLAADLTLLWLDPRTRVRG